MILANFLLVALLAQSQAVSPVGDKAPINDYTRQVAQLTKTSFTLQYYTETPCLTRVQYREGDIPCAAWRPADKKEDLWKTADVKEASIPNSNTTYHMITISGLKPGKRYYYRIYDPDAEVTLRDNGWGAEPPWRREYAVATEASNGNKTIIHLPVKVILMPNVINVASAHLSDGTVAPLPPKMSKENIEMLKQEYINVSRFFFVNSGMRLWVDFQITVDDRYQRWGPEPANCSPEYKNFVICRSYSGQDFAGPGGGDFNVFDTNNPLVKSSNPVYEAKPYSGQVEQAIPQKWNTKTQKWEYYNSGGGTYGVDGFPIGIPGRCQFLGGGDTAWLTCHEFHHQLESYGGFSLSDREDDRIVFDHYMPRKRDKRADGSYDEMTWTTNGKHGEHWDGMAYWDRTLTEAQWLRFYFGYPMVVKDADNDGVPDDNPILPLDEKRFGSSPSKEKTDGEMNDLKKIMLSTWVPSSLQYSYTKPPIQAIKPSPTKPDSDGDGLNDSVDPYPLYPYPPFIYPLTAYVDGNDNEWANVPVGGHKKDGGMEITFKQGHDEDAYYGYFKLTGKWKRVYFTLDGEGMGVFSGVGVYWFEIVKNDTVVMRSTSAATPELNYKTTTDTDGNTIVEFSLPNRGNGKWYWDRGGREIGAAIDFGNETGTTYSIYEPYHAFYCRMLERMTKDKLPPIPPPDVLTAETATKIIKPGDPAIKFTGAGWSLQNGVLTHKGTDESVAYIDGLNAKEFDLWVSFEAKQDAILGAFLPGSKEMNAGVDYISFLGGYANSRTRFRLIGKECGESTVMNTPGKHEMQLSRRDNRVWLLLDGKLLMTVLDPDPSSVIDRLGIIGGYDGNQKLYEMRIRTD